jgi:uncharacterized protein
MVEVSRSLAPTALELLAGFRALVVNGPRQAGKSTLVRHIQHGRGPVVNLDDASLRDLAVADPIGFVDQLAPRVAIDEFQRGGDGLLLALKMAVDADRSPGQFVLAGSTRFLTTRRLSETLAGRVGILELLPLSAGEIRGVRESFVDRVFEGEGGIGSGERHARRDYAELVAIGGFPELTLGPPNQRFRTAWCESYLATVTAASNVEQVADVRRPELLAAMVRQLAAQSSAEIVIADLARELATDEGTVRSYLDVLGTLYLIRQLPAWTTSQTNRAKRRSVLHFVDTALACHLVGATVNDLAQFESPLFGPLLESYVVGELAKQVSWAEHPVQLGHYRDRDKREVDVVLERGRDVVGIEVKASSSPTVAHARHLVYLRDRLGKRFRLGVVLHAGAHTLRLGDRMIAAPISALWAR